LGDLETNEWMDSRGRRRTGVREKGQKEGKEAREGTETEDEKEKRRGRRERERGREST